MFAYHNKVVGVQRDESLHHVVALHAPFRLTYAGCNQATVSLAVAGAALIVAGIAVLSSLGLDPLADLAFAAAIYAYNAALNAWQQDCTMTFNNDDGSGGGDGIFDDFIDL